MCRLSARHSRSSTTRAAAPYRAPSLTAGRLPGAAGHERVPHHLPGGRRQRRRPDPHRRRHLDRRRCGSPLEHGRQLGRQCGGCGGRHPALPGNVASTTTDNDLLAGTAFASILITGPDYTLAGNAIQLDGNVDASTSHGTTTVSLPLTLGAAANLSGPTTAPGTTTPTPSSTRTLST